MDAETQSYLEGILKKNPEDLLPEEKDFLRARRTYLNNEQKRIFASVLGDLPEEPQNPAPTVEGQPAAPAAPEQTENTETAQQTQPADAAQVMSHLEGAMSEGNDHSADPDYQPPAN